MEKKTNRRFERMKKNILANLGILIGLLILCVFFAIKTDSFATSGNFFNLIRQMSINIFLACSMTFVILLGDIDLSVGSVLAVSGCISAGLATNQSLPVPIAILIGIACGMLIGVANGYIVSTTTIPAFIVTLATMNIGRGIARLYTNAKTIPVLNEAYQYLGQGTIFKEIKLPIQSVFIVAVILLCYFILNRTKLGREVYAVGGNKQAAEYVGINVKKVTFFVFVFSSFLAAIAGILTVSQNYAATMIMGTGAEMNAIAAVVLGGVSMSGGKGRLSGTIIGALIIAVLSNGMNLMGIDNSWQYVVQGIVILIAVYIDYFKQLDLKIFKKINKI